MDVQARNSAITIAVKGLELATLGTALLGLNGSGKSTFLGALRKSLEAQGQPVTLLPQSTQLPRRFTCGELLEHVGGLRGVPRGRRRAMADDVLGLVDLESSRDTLVARLSGGMHQRLLIAQSLMSPETHGALLLDEPTVSLDEPQARTVWRVLTDLALDRLVVVASHESQLALAHMAQLLWMERGQVRGPYASNEVLDCASRTGVLVADLFDAGAP